MHAKAWAVLPCTRTASTRVGWRWVREGVDMAARVDCGGNAHAVTRTQHDTTGMGRSERRDATQRYALPIIHSWRCHRVLHRRVTPTHNRDGDMTQQWRCQWKGDGRERGLCAATCDGTPRCRRHADAQNSSDGDRRAA